MDNKANSVEQRLVQIEAKIDEILSKTSLDFTVSDTEMAEIFDLGLENLAKMPYNKLSEYAFMIAKYNAFLHTQINREKVIVNWAQRSIDYLVLPKLADYRVPGAYMSNDEVKMKAIKDNDVAQKLYRIITDKEQTITLFDELGYDVRKMGDYLLEISKSKRFTNG